MIPDSQEVDRIKEEHNRRATRHEPAPTGDGAIILESAVKAVTMYADIAQRKGDPVLHSRHLLVATALKLRAEIGKVKYGTYLRAFNGRNAAVDLYQELLDAIMYSEQCRVEVLYMQDRKNEFDVPDHLLVGAGCLESIIALAANVASTIGVL